MSKYVCSKLSNDVAYTMWRGAKGGPNDLPKRERSITIKGGAGVANDRIVTPDGVITEVDEEQLKALEKDCPSFKRHLERGFLKVLDKSPSDATIKKVASDLEEDKSAPLTPAKLKKEGKKGGKAGSTSN